MISWGGKDQRAKDTGGGHTGVYDQILWEGGRLLRIPERDLDVAPPKRCFAPYVSNRYSRIPVEQPQEYE